MIIGISGKMRAGKNEVANFLQGYYQAQGKTVYVRAFADVLKEEVAEVLAGAMGYPDLSSRQAAVLDFCNKMNSETEKEFFRPILQWWGTEFRRVYCNETYWLQRLWHWAQSVDSDSAVILVPDVRFRNEADMLASIGQVIRINRVGVHPDQHASEVELDDYPFEQKNIILNSGTLEDLRAKAIRWVANE